MIREINTGSDESRIDEKFTNGLGTLKFYHPSGTFSLTPASKILMTAIIESKESLHGIGIDWGSGVGCLAILAAKIAAVHRVYGLEISEKNIAVAVKNAEENEVNNKVQFILADSYSPINEHDKQTIQDLRGKVDFILSNPPSSDWDDGFGYRRIVVDGAKAFLKENGLLLMNISLQYGMDRINALLKNYDGFLYRGVAASTDIVPFDLSRQDLLDCLKIYSNEEINGGISYTFIKDKSDAQHFIDARSALDNFEKYGISPFIKWQTHLFQYTEGPVA